MGTHKVERGPVTERVAANVKAIRTERRLTLSDLADRMRELGRPILKSGLSKIEAGDRRVDVDDLTALAIALQVTPNRLLLTGAIEDEVVGLTGDYQTTDRAAWLWASAEGKMILGVERPVPVDLFDGMTLFDFIAENRPHRPPVRLSPAEWREMKPFEDRIGEIRSDMHEAGLNFRGLVDDIVFEVHDEADPEHAHDHHEQD